MIYSTVLAIGLGTSLAANFYLKNKNKTLSLLADLRKDDNNILTDKLTWANQQLADHGMANYLTDWVKDNDALRKQFEKETGKHAIWGNKETKQFKEWAANK